MLLGAHSVGVLDHAAEVEHGKHGDDHHHTLEQQGELKLLAYPARQTSQLTIKFYGFYYRICSSIGKTL